MFTALNNRRTFEEVCDQIRGQIASGRLKPGDKLPAERDLAQRLDISRAAVREALRSLENAGLVELSRGPRGGAFIRAGDPHRITEAIQDFMTVGTVSVSDLTEARLYLLELVVRLACERATAEDLTEIEENVLRLAGLLTPQSRDELLQCATDFYRLLGRATRNPILNIFVNSLSEIVQHTLWPMTYPKEKLLKSRRALLRALLARDVQAATTEMTRHLISFHNHTLKHAGTTLALSKDVGVEGPAEN